MIIDDFVRILLSKFNALSNKIGMNLILFGSNLFSLEVILVQTTTQVFVTYSVF